MNEDVFRDAIIKLIGGRCRKINTGTFQNNMTSIHSADDVMTLFIHPGYLGYDSRTEEVSIPNNEIMKEFVNATEQEGCEMEFSGLMKNRYSVRKFDRDRDVPQELIDFPETAVSQDFNAALPFISQTAESSTAQPQYSQQRAGSRLHREAERDSLLLTAHILNSLE